MLFPKFKPLVIQRLNICTIPVFIFFLHRRNRCLVYAFSEPRIRPHAGGPGIAFVLSLARLINPVQQGAGGEKHYHDVHDQNRAAGDKDHRDAEAGGNRPYQ